MKTLLRFQEFVDELGLNNSNSYETRNQQGGVSLRFPVFLGFRDDKVGDK